MSSNMVVLVCDTEAKANQAVGFLVGSGIPTSAITKEQVVQFDYDAQTYDGGVTDSRQNKWIVVGRQ